MPIVLDRRSFLKGAALAGSLIAQPLRLRGDDAKTSHWALLSDTHIASNPDDTYRGFFPHRNLKKVVEQVGDGKPDAFIIDGDLARLTGQPEDYAALSNLLGPLTEHLPMVATLGNHDDRKNARGALIKRAGDVQAVEQKLVTVIEAGPVHMIMLDSLMVTNIAAGQLGNAQRIWLSSYLGAFTSRPVVIFLHHNPDPENDGALVDAGQLLSIVEPHRAVKALVYGHTHVYALEKQDGLHLINLPAVGYNFSDGNPVGWVSARFSANSVEMTLHAITGETKDDGKTTALAWR